MKTIAVSDNSVYNALIYYDNVIYVVHYALRLCLLRGKNLAVLLLKTRSTIVNFCDLMKKRITHCVILLYYC